MVFFSLVLAIRHDTELPKDFVKHLYNHPSPDEHRVTIWDSGTSETEVEWKWVCSQDSVNEAKVPGEVGPGDWPVTSVACMGDSGFWVEYLVCSSSRGTWSHILFEDADSALEVSQGPAFRSFKIEVFLEMSQQKLTINNCIKLCEILSSNIRWD